MMVYNLDTKSFWKSKVDEIEKVDDISKQLPWFLECNPDRYPYWWVFLRFEMKELKKFFYIAILLRKLQIVDSAKTPIAI